MATTSNQKEIKRRLASTPGKDDVHEQREKNQESQGLLKRSAPGDVEIEDVKSTDPIRSPQASTTNEDIERADGEGMAPVAPPRAPLSERVLPPDSKADPQATEKKAEE
ncbi:hypothetical protein BH09MYX1_BH09MYX1_00080 [soil metagenome]